MRGGVACSAERLGTHREFGSSGRAGGSSSSAGLAALGRLRRPHTGFSREILASGGRGECEATRAVGAPPPRGAPAPSRGLGRFGRRSAAGGGELAGAECPESGVERATAPSGRVAAGRLAVCRCIHRHRRCRPPGGTGVRGVSWGGAARKGVDCEWPDGASGGEQTERAWRCPAVCVRRGSHVGLRPAGPDEAMGRASAGRKGGTYPAALLPLPGSGGCWRRRSCPENFSQGVCAISS